MLNFVFNDAIPGIMIFGMVAFGILGNLPGFFACLGVRVICKMIVSKYN